LHDVSLHRLVYPCHLHHHNSATAAAMGIASSNTYKPPYEQLANCKVQRLDAPHNRAVGHVTTLEHIVQPPGAIVVLVRRPG